MIGKKSPYACTISVLDDYINFSILYKFSFFYFFIFLLSPAHGRSPARNKLKEECIVGEVIGHFGIIFVTNFITFFKFNVRFPKKKIKIIEERTTQ